MKNDHKSGWSQIPMTIQTLANQRLAFNCDTNSSVFLNPIGARMLLVHGKQIRETSSKKWLTSIPSQVDSRHH